MVEQRIGIVPTQGSLLLGPNLLKSDTRRTVIRRSGDNCLQQSPGFARAANRGEGGGQICEVFRVIWRDSNGDRKFRDSIGKTALLSVNRAEIAVQ